MALNVASLIVKLNADTVGAEANLAKFNGTFGLVGLAAAAVAVGVGVAAVKMAGDFQAGLTTLVTGAGEAKANLGLVGDGIKQLSVQTGTSTTDLINGMYLIESAGYHGAAGLNVLQAAAEGAKVGNASLADVANGVTTVMTDYAKANVSATASTNFLVTTVSLGKTHMQDLAVSMATVLPAASAVGVHLADVGGAMATMTAEGEPAADAATHLKMMLLALEDPSTKAKKTLGEIGLTSQDVASEMQVSLPGALAMIEDHLATQFPAGSAAYNSALASIVGGNKQLQAVLELGGQHLSSFEQNTKKVATSLSGGSKDVKGWADVQQNFNFKMSQAKEAAGLLMINLGQGLLPAATAVATFLTGTLIPGIQNFIGWLNNGSAGANTVKVVLAALGIVIAGALVAAFVSWAVAAGAAAVATIAATWPVLAVGAGIALLIAGIVLLVSHWNNITAVLGVVMGKFHDLWNLLGVVKTIIAVDLANAVHDIGSVFSTVFGGLEAIVKAPINAVIDGLNVLIGGLDSIGFTVPSWVPLIGGDGFHFSVPKIPHLAEGGLTQAGGFNLVGERGPELLYTPQSLGVLPANQTSSLLQARSVSGLPSGLAPAAGPATGGQPMTIVLQVDGRTLAQVVTKYQPGVIRQATGTRAF